METFKFAIIFIGFMSDYLVSGNTLCAYSKKDNVKYKRTDTVVENETVHQHFIGGHNVDTSNTEHCSRDSDSCYALWHEDPVNKSIIILTQGCWDSSGDVNCGYGECIANKKPPKALNNTKFCCCSGNLCNINVTDGYVTPLPDSNENINPAVQHVEPLIYTSSSVIVISVAATTVFIVLALLMYYLTRFYFHTTKRSKESLHLIESASSPSPTFDFDNLKIQETIGRGRYGTVCRGTLHDYTVAVKIFSYQNKQYFLNEKDIYSLNHMDHPSLLKLIGSEERLSPDGRLEYLLVLSYSPVGCLQDFLRNTTIDWTRLCKMSSSIARGLAHLHTEIGKGDKLKPCIAHRDITSRNILMKTDETCMLCDFGFAVRISGSKYYLNGEEQVAETTSLADVGTLRYMAPEILEGAVNLRDCESSLKQIDVYALGLVLWEIATKCSDLFQGVEVPEYKLPFEAEVGVHPTMEQMQVLVTRHKARPLFPDIWKDSNPAVRTLKETIEECWDQDAEARLTTLCVEERLAELPVFWERYKAGLVAPNGNATSIITSSIQKPNLSMNKLQSSNDNMTSDCLNNCDTQCYIRERARSLSEGTTDTLLSPLEPAPKELENGINKNIAKNSNNNNNNNHMSSKVSMPIQPHQGRNPCLERNLIMEPVTEFAISGNTLLGNGVKPTADRNFHSLSDGDVNIFDSPILENGALVSDDNFAHSTQMNNPIPYVMNSVYHSTVPKQLNLPGNGHNVGRPKSKIKNDRHWGHLSIFDRKKRAKEGLRAGLKSLLDRKSSNFNQRKDLSEEQLPLRSSVGSCYSPTSPNTLDANYGQSNAVWTHEDVKGTDQLIDTEVRVLKPEHNTIVVQPINSAQNIPKMKEIQENTEHVKLNLDDSVLRRDVTKMDLNVQMGSNAEKCKRPNSLPLYGFQSCGIETCNDGFEENHDTLPVCRKNSTGKRKGVKRVKTPFEVKGRFSLYDDRIMSSQELSATYLKETVHSSIAQTNKFSTSVPLNMNSLGATGFSNGQQVDLLNGINEQNNEAQINRRLQVIHSLCDI